MNAGDKLGHYIVAGKLGAGGMGEVYRATDTKLGRDVALKVLPPAFAQDAQRMARFQREAHVLASLNHPHIAAIYGLEESSGTGFQPVLSAYAQAKSASAALRAGAHHFALVMELVEGPTLAERITQSAFPLDEALPIARQIAESLEYAHDRGIIHRDLKPANIKLTPDGSAKLLDFGLAKALAGDSSSDADVSNSPTLSMAATKAGIILGTAAYMPPEQARGKSVDRRADIWSFGCVLYEMLTGSRAFVGEDVSETLAAIIRGEPDWTALPLAPRHPIRTLLRRCLEKDAKRRLQAIGEARVTIEDYLANPSAAEAAAAADVTAPAPAGVKTARATRVAWAVAAVATIAALALAVVPFRRPAEEQRTVRAAIPPPEKVYFDFANSPYAGPMALSPDGRLLVDAAHREEGQQILWLRAMDAIAAQPLPGTEGGSFPFWSPDSRTIGFFAGDKMKKIEAGGGPAITLCDASTGRGGTWNREGVIVFGRDANSPLHQVSAAGGASRPVTELNQERGENTHRWPHFLPDGRHFLYLARIGQVGAGEGTGIWLASLSGGPPKRLIAAASNAVFAAGHILFARDSLLMAQAFDAHKLELSGEAFPIAEGIQNDASFSRGVFSASETGVLIYHTGALSPGTSLEWFDRRGKRLGTLGEPSVYIDLKISPDGSKVAVAVADPRIGPPDVWIFETARGLRTRFTFDPGSETNPVWSPDGTRLVYRTSTVRGIPDLYTKSVAGASQESLLLESALAKIPISWSSDGRFLAYETRGSATTVADIWILPLGEGGKPTVFLETRFREGQPHFSPDGRWLAYVSDESGRDEVYVTPFPGPGRKWQISTSGGDQPRWRRDGKEIFYLAHSNAMTAVEVSARADTFDVGAAKPLFQALPLRGGNAYDVTADGQRFLVNLLLQQQSSEPMTLVINWPEAL
ncbi:MAG: protein kinase domain-containing protein, partial [Candidatus Acidiferrales bacterium]